MDLSTWEIVGRLAIAASLGAAIGLERELDSQPAGFRTHLLVALGSALFTVAGASVVGADPSRVAAQVASGIGFLGAGAILRDRARVHGLTTAASLWVTASLGLAAGFGEWQAALTVALIALTALTVLKWVERTFFPHHRSHEVVVDLAQGTSVRSTVAAVTAVLGRFEVRELSPSDTGLQRVSGVAHPPQETPLVELAQQLAEIDGVVTVDMDLPGSRRLR